MEAFEVVGSPVDAPREIVTKIEQKALRLSALLRDVDNHPVELDHPVLTQLDDVLELLQCRISATRTLLHQGDAISA